MDVGEVHFEGVFVFVGREGHFGEFGGLLELGDCSGVEEQVAEGGRVAGALGEGAAGEVDVVGGAEEEYAFSEDCVRMLCTG